MVVTGALILGIILTACNETVFLKMESKAFSEQDIQSLSGSAVLVHDLKIIFMQNQQCIVVYLSFYLSARPSSFFLHF